MTGCCLLLALLLQRGDSARARLSVGDTVWIERTLGDVGTAIVRPQVWSLGELGEQLAPAEVLQGSRGTLVRYALVLWYPGEQLLSMPGPVLVRRDGSSDTLAATRYKLRLESVLPAGAKRSELEPKPARPTIPLASRSLLAAAVLVGAVLLGVLVTALFWRRRGRVPKPPAPVEVFPSAGVLRRWGEAGEYRAALDGWNWRLARRLALSRDLEEIAVLQRLLDEIADRVFLPAARAGLATLCRRAAELDPA